MQSRRSSHRKMISQLFALPHPIKPRNGEATAQIIDQHNKTYTSSIHYLGMRGSRKVSCDALANKKVHAMMIE